MKFPADWSVWDWMLFMLVFAISFAIVFPVFIGAISSIIYGKSIQNPEFMQRMTELITFLAGNVTAILARKLGNHSK